MFKHMIRWIVVIAALLIVATALAFSPLVQTHASGVHTKATPAISTPASSDTTPGGEMTPDMFRHG